MMQNKTVTMNRKCYNTGFEYELNIIEVEKQPLDCQAVALNADVAVYGIFYGNNHSKIFMNDDCTYGCFYLPFIPCDSPATLEIRISKLIGMYLAVFSRSQPANSIKILVYKIVDENNCKHAAIGLVNKESKADRVKELNVQTTMLDFGSESAANSWISLLSELSLSPNDSAITEIEISEILDFESRMLKVFNINEIGSDKPMFFTKTGSCHVLLLNPCESAFYASHYQEPSSNFFYDKDSRRYGSLFKMKTYRMTSMDEIRANVVKMINTFRMLTGILTCKTVALYHEVSPSIYDVSIGTFAIDVNFNNQQEENDHF